MVLKGRKRDGNEKPTKRSVCQTNGENPYWVMASVSHKQTVTHCENRGGKVCKPQGFEEEMVR